MNIYMYFAECRNAALLSLIPVLCPSNIRLRIGGHKIWRPTIVESIDSFICHIKVKYLQLIEFHDQFLTKPIIKF